MDDAELVKALLAGDPEATPCFHRAISGDRVFALFPDDGPPSRRRRCVSGGFRSSAAGHQRVSTPIVRSRPWLLGIAANRCRTALSTRARRPPSAEGVEERIDTRTGIADPDDLATELALAIDRLRPSTSWCSLCITNRTMPYEAIAVVVERPVGTVKTWLHRARLELADYLSRRGVRC